METDHLLLYADLHRAPSPVEMDANLVYLEGQVESTTATAAAALASKVAAEAAKVSAEEAMASANQDKLDAATSAAQALAAKTLAEQKANEAAETVDGLNGIRPDFASAVDGKGDALMAVKQPFAGSVAVTQHEFNKDFLSIRQFMTGTSAAEVDVAIAAVATQSSDVYVPAGTFTITTASVQYLPRLVGPGYVSLNGTSIPAGMLRASIDLPVPSVFPTIYDAWDYLGSRVYDAEVVARIVVADGTHDIDRTLFKIPFGLQTEIVSASLNPAACILRWMGPVWVSGSTANQISFLNLEKGAFLRNIDGFTLDGNSRRGQSTPPSSSDPHAMLVRRNSHITIGKNMLVKDWARVGVLANQASTALILGDATTHAVFSGCYTEGVVASSGCQIIAQYTECNGNSGNGFWADAAGSILGTQLTANGNTSAGFLALNAGVIELDVGTGGISSTSNTNGGPGLYANGGSLIVSPRARVAGNGAGAENQSSNVVAILGSKILMQGTSSGHTIIDGGEEHGIYALTGSYVNAERAEIKNHTLRGIWCDNSRMDATLAIVTANAGGGVLATNSSHIYGDLMTIATTADAVNSAEATRGSSLNIPRVVATATGANSKAIRSAGGNVTATSGTVSNTGSGTSYASFCELSGVANLVGSTVTGTLSPAANTSGTRNSYNHT